LVDKIFHHPKVQVHDMRNTSYVIFCHWCF